MTSMALLLNIPKSTLHKWMNRNGLETFVKKENTNCHFCHLKAAEKAVEPAIDSKIKVTFSQKISGFI